MALTTKMLMALPEHKRAETIALEYYKCSLDPKYCIETYFTVMAGQFKIPFKLFPHQAEALTAYETYQNNITMKTRQMGFTTFTAAYIVWKIITQNNYKALLISKSMNDSQKFLEDIIGVIERSQEEYGWLIPQFDTKNKRKIIMKGSKSSVEAQATGADAGRGISGLNLLVVDEVAFIDRNNPEKMAEIWSAAGPALTTTKGKAILISTPKGTAGFYYDTYTNAKEKGFNVIDAHWLKHPQFSQGAYKWVVDITKPAGGYIKFYTDTWPDFINDPKQNKFVKISKEEYKFITDGKLRSPWYDLESVRLGPQRTKCELDCSFTGTGGEVFDADELREMKVYSESRTFYNPYEHLKGTFRKYREFKDYIEGHKYVIAADVATGDGLDYSTAIVFDMTAFEIVGTYKDQIIPAAFAKFLTTLGRDFGTCQLVVENQGGGFTTLQTMKQQLGYPNIYYSTLNRKDPSTGMKKKKIGLWASEDVRLQGGDKVEECIRVKDLNVPCTILVEEFYNWIWDKDGKRRHAPEKHDDLIMALQHGLWYYFYVYSRGERNRSNFKKMFEVQRGNQRIKLTDEPHGKGSIVKRTESFVVSQTKMGNIDNIVDPRVLGHAELEQSTLHRRRYFI